MSQATARDQAVERLIWSFSDAARPPASPYLAAPARHASERLGIDLIEKQAEMLQSVAANRATAVESGHGVGKSLGAAAAACWWLDSHEEAVVVTVAPTHQHVNDILWRHIRHLAEVGDLPGRVLDTPKWNIGKRRYAVGLSPKKGKEDDVAGLHGYHSPHLLVILDECQSMPISIWEAVETLTVATGNRILVIGNPISQNGPFYDATKSASWNSIRISCLEHPNVVQKREIVPGAVSYEWVCLMVEKHCTPCERGTTGAIEWPPGSDKWWMPDAWFSSRVLGIAPDEADDQLIPLRWVADAQSWVADAEGEAVLAFDPSRYGRDPAAMCLKRGARVMWFKRRQPQSPNPTDEQVGWVVREARENSVARVFIDIIGLGAGVVDGVRKKGINVVPVNFGAGATERTKYVNKRAECAWRCREALQRKAISLPDDDLITGDLTAPKFWDDDKGRILIEPKKALRLRLRRSPNYGDALWLMYAEDEGREPPPPEKAEESVAPQSGRWGSPVVAVVRAPRGGSRWRINN